MTKEQAEARVKQNKAWRKRLDELLQEMKTLAIGGSSRHRSLSITHLEDSIMRLGMDNKEVREEWPEVTANPYPESYNPESAVVEPPADGLKL